MDYSEKKLILEINFLFEFSLSVVTSLFDVLRHIRPTALPVCCATSSTTFRNDARSTISGTRTATAGSAGKIKTRTYWTRCVVCCLVWKMLFILKWSVSFWRNKTYWISSLLISIDYAILIISKVTFKTSASKIIKLIMTIVYFHFYRQWLKLKSFLWHCFTVVAGISCN